MIVLNVCENGLSVGIVEFVSELVKKDVFFFSLVFVCS